MQDLLNTISYVGGLIFGLGFILLLGIGAFASRSLFVKIKWEKNEPN